MEQTAVEKMIQYFIEQKDNGASHWCINDLIAQLYQAKAMEKEQIIEFTNDYVLTQCNASFEGNVSAELSVEEYYELTFKSE